MGGVPLWRLHLSRELVEPDAPGALRYADGRVTPDGHWYVCVRERHGSDRREAVNEIVAVATDGSFRVEVLAGGAEHPRDLPVPGRDLAGVHFAMDFLVQQNRRMAGENIPTRRASAPSTGGWW